MTDYVELPGEQSLLPPGTFENTRFFYFVLPADEQRLRALCDKYFNVPSGGQLSYHPLGVVLLAFTHVDRLTSAEPARGGITYKDIALWVPVWGGHARAKPLCLFPPFIFVDDASTMATGRELYGLPKQLGRFQMPLDLAAMNAAAAPQFRAEVVGTLQPGGHNDWRTLLTVEKTAAGALGRFEQFVAKMDKLLLPAALQKFDVPAWLQHLTSVSALGLKQIRDAAQPGKACYQAAVEAPLSMVQLTLPPSFFFDAFELTLMDVPSHPIAAVLGLQPGVQRVPLAIHFAATMRMDAGATVWKAATP